MSSKFESVLNKLNLSIKDTPKPIEINIEEGLEVSSDEPDRQVTKNNEDIYQLTNIRNINLMIEIVKKMSPSGDKNGELEKEAVINFLRKFKRNSEKINIFTKAYESSIR